MSKGRILALCVVLITLTVGIAGCGGDSHESASGEMTKATGEEAARAFLEGMVPHHVSAVEMAELAQERSVSPFILRISGDIVRTQKSEIKEMETTYQRLFGSELVPDESAHMRLGLSAEDAGMTSMDGAMTLADAQPFDRAFIDQMVGHHRGAIAMAESVLAAEVSDAKVNRLASTIITEQEREIRELNEYRLSAYGGPVPEASADDDDSSSDPMEGMGH